MQLCLYNKNSVGITDAALSWLHSYIIELYQRLAVDSATSAECVMNCGVPQGSALEPIIYCIHTRLIGYIVARHGMQFHCYGDDTQIYNHRSNHKDRTMFDGGD